MLKKVPVKDVGYYYRKDVDFDRVLELRREGVSAENVKWFVKRDRSRPVVGWLGQHGFEPSFLKKYDKARNNLVVLKKAWKRFSDGFIRRGYRYGRDGRKFASVGDWYGVAHNYCN